MNINGQNTSKCYYNFGLSQNLLNTKQKSLHKTENINNANKNLFLQNSRDFFLPKILNFKIIQTFFISNLHWTCCYITISYRNNINNLIYQNKCKCTIYILPTNKKKTKTNKQTN